MAFLGAFMLSMNNDEDRAYTTQLNDGIQHNNECGMAAPGWYICNLSRLCAHVLRVSDSALLNLGLRSCLRVAYTTSRHTAMYT